MILILMMSAKLFTPGLLERRGATAVDPRHLKVKDDITLTKNDYITISAFKMQQILGPYEVTSYGHSHPKIIESTFRFPEFVPACKKLVHPICSCLR